MKEKIIVLWRRKTKKNPISIVQEIQAIIGNEGCVAGGAIRDCILGRTPKDYDIFLFNTEAEDLVDFVDSLREHGIKRKGDNSQSDRYTHRYLPVLNAKFHGLDLQFVVNTDSPTDVHEVVDRFAFTVSMGACDPDGDFVIPQCTQEALDRHEIVANPNFVNYDLNGQTQSRLLDTLLKRGQYLAEKLEFTFGKHSQDYLKAVIKNAFTEVSETIANRTF